MQRQQRARAYVRYTEQRNPRQMRDQCPSDLKALLIAVAEGDCAAVRACLAQPEGVQARSSGFSLVVSKSVLLPAYTRLIPHTINLQLATMPVVLNASSGKQHANGASQTGTHRYSRDADHFRRRQNAQTCA